MLCMTQVTLARAARALVSQAFFTPKRLFRFPSRRIAIEQGAVIGPVALRAGGH